MSRRKSLILILSLAVICLPAALFAEGQKGGVRPCRTSDLIGTWEMKNISAKIKLDFKDSFGWPYQRYAFDRRGDVKEMTSTTPIESDKAKVKKFDNAASTSKFTINERGILSISKIESPNPETCMCSYATKDVPEEILAKIPAAKRAQIPHKGDIVLTYVNSNSQPVLIKSFRRV